MLYGPTVFRFSQCLHFLCFWVYENEYIVFIHFVRFIYRILFSWFFFCFLRIYIFASMKLNICGFNSTCLVWNLVVDLAVALYSIRWVVCWLGTPNIQEVIKRMIAILLSNNKSAFPLEFCVNNQRFILLFNLNQHSTLSNIGYMLLVRGWWISLECKHQSTHLLLLPKHITIANIHQHTFNSVWPI